MFKVEQNFFGSKTTGHIQVTGANLILQQQRWKLKYWMIDLTMLGLQALMEEELYNF